MTKKKKYIPLWTLKERAQLVLAFFGLMIVLLLSIPFPELFERRFESIVEFFKELD